MTTPHVATGQRRQQAERSAASTKAMLDAAVELIVEKGAKVSMMAIGERSGFSHGLVMARFGSKGALLEAVAREVQQRFARGVEALSGGATGLVKLRAIIDAYVRTPADDEHAFYVLLGESLGPEPHLRAAFARADTSFRRYVHETLEEAQRLGEVDESVEPETAAVLLVGMFRGIATQYLVNSDAVEMDALRTAAHDLVSRYVSPAATGRARATRPTMTPRHRSTKGDAVCT